MSCCVTLCVRCVPACLPFTQPGATARVRDLWLRKELGILHGALSRPVQAHSAEMLRLWFSGNFTTDV